MTTADQPGHDQRALVEALLEPARYPHPVDRVEHLETHISHLLLAGDYVYKIKKPLNLGFLDFTTLARRHAACREELRLNRRTAPGLYLDLVAICGHRQNPVLGGDPARAIEYAVRMTRFPQEHLGARLLAAGRLSRRDMAALGRELAAFHARIPPAGPAGPYGAPRHVLASALDNLTALAELPREQGDEAMLVQLEAWTRGRFRALEAALAARREAGFVRECHGDLHLGNLVWLDGRLVPFDALEFSPRLRWTDTMADLAFVLMDLERREARELARRLREAYLTYSGDFQGLKVLPFYQVYRALVRAKVAAIALDQGHEPARRARRSHLDLALAYSRPPRPVLIITHGLSGSGKTFVTDRLLEGLDLVRLRSDVERKRLFGLDPGARSHSRPGEGIYAPGAGEATYERLASLAGTVLDAGYGVIVDATFLEQNRRRAFRELARRYGVPFLLLALRADPATLEQRLVRRQAEGRDAAEADVAILQRQRADYRPPAPDEAPLWVDTQDRDDLIRQVMERLETRNF